jgi:thiol:disulfide interchange protein DsbD
MTMVKTTCIAVAAVLLTTAAAPGQEFEIPGLPDFDEPQGGPSDSSSRVKTQVKALSAEVAQGNDLPVAIVFDIDPTWHIWTEERPAPEGMGTFEFAIDTEILVSEGGPLVPHPGFMVWPEFHAVTADIGDGPQQYAVFDGRAVVYLPVTVPTDAPTGATSLDFTITYQTCNDKTCLAPATDNLTLDVTIVPAGQATAPIDENDADFGFFPADLFPRIRGGEKAPSDVSFDLFGLKFSLNASAPTGFALLLLVAALGGFLLNLTPCVLPVIPLKIMGLSHSASGSRGRTLVLGIAMSAGVIGFWLLLGGLIAGVSGFTATNQLFQYPAFTITVGVFIAVMAIGMCGLFSIRLPQAVYMVNPSQETLHGSVLFGVMTAILSTPCTAPFMGAAAAWAALQPTGTTLATFAAIGVGMAMPYFVLAAFPKLVDRMPRTGPASELIKHVMGLLMLAAAAYFIGVGLSGALVSPPDPPTKAYFWFVGLLGVAAGVWLTWKTIAITKSASRRAIFGGLGVLIAAISAAIAIRVTDKGPINWVYYTPERFEEAKSGGNVVVMEFTAEWCLNCKALEESVLRQREIVDRLNGEGVVPIKVDLTGNNVEGNDMLEAVNRLTIPLLVVFSSDGREVFKGDFYTVEQVTDAIAEAETARVASN